MSDDELELRGLRPVSREEIEIGMRFTTALLYIGAILRPDNPVVAVLSSAIGQCCETRFPREELHKMVDDTYDMIESNRTRIDSFVNGGPSLKIVADPPSSPFSSEEAPTKP